MKNKNVFIVAIISLIVFMGIATYLWYWYFHDYEGRLIAENSSMEFIRGVEFVNTGGINYINANPDDDDSIIPVYYFSVKNKVDKEFEYVITLDEEKSNDGCSESLRFERSELVYELKLDNKIIKEGGLDTLENNVIDTNIIKGKSTNDYSLKIRLKDDTVDYDKKHFHYVVNLREKK